MIDVTPWRVSFRGAQVTIGTLVLQDCTVGLMFAMLPVLGGAPKIPRIEPPEHIISAPYSPRIRPSHELPTQPTYPPTHPAGHGTLGQFTGAVVRIFLMMTLFLTVCSIAAHKGVGAVLRWADRTGEELFLIIAVALCLSVAWLSDRMGLSLELGAFVAGVMVSGSPHHAEKALHAIEGIRTLFSALFLASIGLLMNPRFLWQHLDILLVSLFLVVAAKATLVCLVVRAFGYSNRTALSVGVAMAQVGEFSFVLLSRASNLGLVQRPAYLLLLGTTALSLFTTPVRVVIFLWLLASLCVRVSSLLRAVSSACSQR